MNRNGVILLALRVISRVEWSQRCLIPVQEESSLHYQMITLDPRSLHRIGRGWTHNTKETQHKQIHRKSLVVGPLRCDWSDREVRCRAHCDYARRHSEPSDAEPKPIISTKKGEPKGEETREIRWNLAKPETANSMMRFFRGWTQSPNGNLSADRPAAPCGPPRSPSKKRTRGPVCSQRLRINGLDVKIFFFYLYHELNEAVHTEYLGGGRLTIHCDRGKSRAIKK